MEEKIRKVMGVAGTAPDLRPQQSEGPVSAYGAGSESGLSPFRMKDKVREIFGADNPGVRFDEPMSGHTTLRIGGAADVFVTPQDIDSLRDIVVTLRREGVPVIAVGEGSNLLVSDYGFEGAVVSTAALNRIEVVEKDRDGVVMFVEAGTPLRRLMSFSRDNGYKGLEGMAGIPGFIGGAVKGNSGSFGFEIGNVVLSVMLVDKEDKILVVGKEKLGFGYRSSAVADGDVIIGASVRLEKDDPLNVAERITGFLEQKRKKQPVSERTAGCVFRNPEGVSAGKLIEDSGCKGLRRGGAEVSAVHANFFVNTSNATAGDFLGLMETVKERVMRKFGIELEPEIKIVGKGV